MEPTDKGQRARALQQHQEHLEAEIERILQEYETDHEGPFEIDVSFYEGEGGTEMEEGLRSRIERIVDAFHRNPVVERTGVVVHKVTAIDSDGDGSIAVRVHYEYPDVD